MKGFRLYHPWWTHLPALALWLASGAVLASVASLPGPWPTHWSSSGQPDGWASTWWEFPLVVLLGGAMLMAISVAIDGLFAHDENGRKSFNVLCVIDELGFTLFFAASLGYAAWVRHGPQPFWTPTVWAAGGAAVVAALLLEALRPAGPRNERPMVDTEELVRDLAARQASGQRWVYWSVQAPRYVRMLMAVPGGLFLLVFVVPQPGAALYAALAIAAGVCLMLSGGFRAQVTPQRLLMRPSSWGPRLLSIATSDIVEATACEFHPLRQFGGWGIRLGRIDGHFVTAFNLEGNTGVLIRNAKDKRYLIGTSEPERLLAVLNVARGKAAAA